MNGLQVATRYYFEILRFWDLYMPLRLACFFCPIQKSIMATRTITQLTITSEAFTGGGPIPSKYTCEGENINPPLDIGTIPQETKCLALIMEDPDAPRGIFTHWVMWNIPVTNHIEENSAPGMQGNNSYGKREYAGPCPPSGIHRYYFKVYALSEELTLPEDATKEDLITAMKDYVLSTSELMGRYEKQQKGK
jgi:Raf kinase inhibitor-like YbhB/YbcL family protein